MFDTDVNFDLLKIFFEEAEIPPPEDECFGKSWENIRNYCLQYLDNKIWNPNIEKALSMEVIGENECWKKLIAEYTLY